VCAREREMCVELVFSRMPYRACPCAGMLLDSTRSLERVLYQ